MIKLEIGKCYKTSNHNGSDLIFRYDGHDKYNHISIYVIRDLDSVKKRFNTDRTTTLHDGSYIVYNNDTVLINYSELLAYLL